MHVKYSLGTLFLHGILRSVGWERYVDYFLTATIHALVSERCSVIVRLNVES